MEDTDRSNICIGGTFSPLHRGHLQLLRTAFDHGKKVFVGLTNDAMAQRSRDRTVMSYKERYEQLEKVLKDLSKQYSADYTIREISDRFGFAVKEEIDAIVVSRETEPTTDEIDKERIKRGLEPLKRYVVDMVLDDKGSKISSTRVEKGEIDREGRYQLEKLRADQRVCVHLGSKNREKAIGVINAFTRYYNEVQLFKYEVKGSQGIPGSDDPIQGARSRVEEVRSKTSSSEISARDHLVGIESGLIEKNGIWFMVHCCYISFKGKEGFGMSSGYEITPDMLESIMSYRGTTWEIKDITGIRRSLIENLSGGSMSRDSLVEESCRMALLSLFNSLKGRD
jgi:pantetheine-phosphate adenylyltransferase